MGQTIPQYTHTLHLHSSVDDPLDLLIIFQPIHQSGALCLGHGAGDPLGPILRTVDGAGLAGGVAARVYLNGPV
jgi:hypothetical protein